VRSINRTGPRKFAGEGEKEQIIEKKGETFFCFSLKESRRRMDRSFPHKYGQEISRFTRGEGPGDIKCERKVERDERVKVEREEVQGGLGL